jgi:hypothetical protein
VFTSGADDGVVNMWALQPAALEAQITLAGKGLEPFLNMLDESGAGAEGPFYREMEDYFYYAQLRRYPPSPFSLFIFYIFFLPRVLSDDCGLDY